MSVTISTSVDIHAPAQAVWDVLTDFAAYGEWNPFMRIEGTAAPGTRLVVHMGADGRRGMAFKPTVLAAVPGRELRWVGKLGPGWPGETFSGALVALVKLLDKGNLEQNHNGYDDFNQALKQRAETISETR